MTFEEWCAKKGFFDDVGNSYIQAMRMAWKAAQEDMRERAAKEAETMNIPARYECAAGEYVANAIRALPIEV